MEWYSFDRRQISALLDDSLAEDMGNLHMLKVYPPGEPYFDPAESVVYMDFLSETLIPRAAEIHDVYTRLPEDLPQRVADLAASLTETYSNDYMKAVVINSFLRTHFPYTLTPGDTPEGRDFVDYFLFDLQKGYCTYFATAFVVLCRAVGIPARYVEGFTAPIQGHPVYALTNRQAHAWAEVYLEGYGWHMFEPTPPEHATGQRFDMLPSPEEYPLNDDQTGRPITIAMSETAFNFNRNTTPDRPHNDAPVLAVLPSGYNAADLLSIFSTHVFTAIGLGAAAVVLYVLTRYAAYRISLNGISGKPNNEAVRAYFAIILKHLKHFNYEKSPGETISQFIETIIKNPLPDIGIGSGEMEAVADIVSRACYGPGQVSSEETQMILRVLKALERGRKKLL